MTRKMIINAQDPEEVRIAILDDGILTDFEIETREVEKNKGNIYKGTVMAVEPSLNAAFVDYGSDKQGFLTANDVDARLCGFSDDERSYRINELLKPRQPILVQVSKDEVGSKGAVLTTYLSLAGRYVVLMPGSARHGVSRKIEDEETRQRMRDSAAMLDVPENIGVIVRTAGSGRTRVELNRDMRVLLRLWASIQKATESAKAPALIFKERDVVIRALRDYFSEDTDEVVLDSDDAFDRASEYMRLVMPRHQNVLTRYVERRPIFHHYKIEEQLEGLYLNRVTLPSGGSIVIEPTEALVSIDVNSGKQKASGQEETAFETNLAAAAEIARQLKLRDLGGIIVIDFIDMATRKHEQRVEKALKAALNTDKARVKIGRISPNGTLELTRQRIRSALEVSMFRTCEACHGTGRVLKPEVHAVAVLRRLRDRAARGDLKAAHVRLEPTIANHVRTERWKSIQEIEQRFKIRIDITPDDSFLPDQDDFTFETDPHAVVLPLEEPNFGPAPRFEEDDVSPEDELDMEMEESDMEEGRRTQGRYGDRSLDRGDRGRSRQRGRSDERGDRSSRQVIDVPTGAIELGMPTFELLDPKDAGISTPRREARGEPREKREGRGDKQGGRDAGRRPSGAKRPRQGEEGTTGQSPRSTQETASARSATSPRPPQKPSMEKPAAQTMAEPTPVKKPGLFARLFGFGKK